MSGGKEIEGLSKTIKEMMRKGNPSSTVYGTVKSVNPSENSATVTGLLDGLDYFGIRLGLGSLTTLPKPGTACLIGIIEGNNATGYLIHADEVEEYRITAGESMVTVKEEGTVISRGNESLVDVHNDLIEKIGELCDAVNAIVVTNGVGPNIPVITAIKTILEGPLKARLNDILK